MKTFLIAASVTLFAGCTHFQLRYDALHQAEAVHELQQQMVLDNLAMFVANPDSIPYFTEVSSGSSQVTDTGSASTTPSWVRRGFAGITATLSGNRLNQENFALDPVTDPFRLTWMRCAYRSAVGAPVDPHQAAECTAIIGSWDKSCTICAASSQCSSLQDGTTNASCDSRCLPGPGWFCVADKHLKTDVRYVGRYGDTCICVPPEGREELGRLTMAIVGFAAAKRQTNWQRNWSCCCDPCAPPIPQQCSDPKAPCNQTQDGTAARAETDRATKPAATPPSLKTPNCTINESTVIGDDGGSGGGGGGGGKPAKAAATPAVIQQFVLP
jgi:hypothetical protein